MIIKVKHDGKFIKVSVSYPDCPEYQCFSPHKYEHKGTTIDEKQNNWTDKNYSCSYKNYNGCPDKPRKKDD